MYTCQGTTSDEDGHAASGGYSSRQKGTGGSDHAPAARNSTRDSGSRQPTKRQRTNEIDNARDRGNGTAGRRSESCSDHMKVIEFTNDISDDSKVAVDNRDGVPCSASTAPSAKEPGATDGYISFSESESVLVSDGDNTNCGAFQVPVASDSQAPTSKVQQRDGEEADDDKWDWGDDSSEDDIDVAPGSAVVGGDSAETPPEPRVAIDKLGRRGDVAPR